MVGYWEGRGTRDLRAHVLRSLRMAGQVDKVVKEDPGYLSLLSEARNIRVRGWYSNCIKQWFPVLRRPPKCATNKYSKLFKIKLKIPFVFSSVVGIFKTMDLGPSAHVPASKEPHVRGLDFFRWSGPCVWQTGLGAEDKGPLCLHKKQNLKKGEKTLEEARDRERLKKTQVRRQGAVKNKVRSKRRRWRK